MSWQYWLLVGVLTVINILCRIHIHNCEALIKFYEAHYKEDES